MQKHSKCFPEEDQSEKQKRQKLPPKEISSTVKKEKSYFPIKESFDN